jgi:uncharacterized membrane protein YeiH
MLLHILDIFGTFAFAISGAFRAVKYELDLLGVIALATATGIGGGITRDLLLGSTPPAALVDQTYLLICIAGAMVVFVAAPRIATRWDYVMAADAVGLSVFAAIGAAKAELFQAAPLTVIMLATITASGGGVVRDLLVLEIPAALKSDFYATAALLGGTLFVLLGALGVTGPVRLAASIAFTLALRIVAMHFVITLPRVKSLPSSPSQLTKARRERRKKDREKGPGPE